MASAAAKVSKVGARMATSTVAKGQSKVALGVNYNKLIFFTMNASVENCPVQN